MAETNRIFEQSYGLVNDLFKEVKNSSDDEAYLQLLNDFGPSVSLLQGTEDLIQNLNALVLQDARVQNISDL